MERRGAKEQKPDTPFWDPETKKALLELIHNHPCTANTCQEFFREVIEPNKNLMDHLKNGLRDHFKSLGDDMPIATEIIKAEAVNWLNKHISA